MLWKKFKAHLKFTHLSWYKDLQIFNKSQASQRGFTLIDTVLSLAVVTIASATIFMVVTEINNTDTATKHNKLTYDLVTPYLDYYKTAEINRSNYRAFSTDFTTVDLVEERENRAYIENLIEIVLEKHSKGELTLEIPIEEVYTLDVMTLESYLQSLDLEIARKDAQLPNMYKDLNVVCTNNPYIIQSDDKGKGAKEGAKYDSHVVFNISCWQDDKAINADLNDFVKHEVNENGETIENTAEYHKNDNFINNYVIVRYIEN